MSAEQGFRLHPLAAHDIIGIREHIADDSPLAARLVREEIPGRIRAVVPFPHQGHKRPDPHRTAPALHFGARISDCLRAGRKAPLGCCRDARASKSPRDGCNPERPGVPAADKNEVHPEPRGAPTAGQDDPFRVEAVVETVTGPSNFAPLVRVDGAGLFSVGFC